jgi:hypothetical protein
MHQHGTSTASRKLRDLPRKFVAAIRCLSTLTVLLLTLGCCEGKSLLGGAEDNGADEAIVLVQRPQSFEHVPSPSEEPVFTGHHRKPSAQVVRSISLEDESPLEGHRFSNGLNAPLRA